MKQLLAILCLLSLAPWANAESTAVRASFYSARYDGRRTATGERFSSKRLTAAHLTLPLGTRVRLTNPENGTSIEVVINDRGPYERGRDISLTRRGARELGFLRKGVATLEMEVLAPQQ